MSDFSVKFLGLSGKKTLFPARLLTQETVWGNNVSAAMFPRLQRPLKKRASLTFQGTILRLARNYAVI